jgi:phosphatidylinositol-3-phosphatase
MTMKVRFLMPLLVFRVVFFCTNVYSQLPVPKHVVFVIFENHSYDQILGNSAAPYLNGLVRDSATALFTQSYALTHPSQPDYLMLFSGSDQGVTNNDVPKTLPFTSPNLGAGLLQAGRTFAGYSEDLPAIGFDGKSSGHYARKHNPWVNWQGAETNGIPGTLNLPLTSFPSNYDLLPTVSFVIPNQDHDMHNGTDPKRINKADAWLRDHLDGYVQWAQSHNSLLIITFDEGYTRNGNLFNRIFSFFRNEDESGMTESNHIFTAFVGGMVKHGSYDQKIDHYSVLRTIEEMYGLSHDGSSAASSAISNVWKKSNRM